MQKKLAKMFNESILMKSLYCRTARLMVNPRAWESVDAVSGRKTWLFRMSDGGENPRSTEKQCLQVQS
jgi:hypothetical protein